MSDDQVSLDPGKPVDVIPTHYWTWVEAVRLYWQSDRASAPLSPKLDLHPIIFRFYRPRKGAKTRPNPFLYSCALKRAGLLRKFGDADFWVPETEVTIRVGGQIVYTLGDLDALLASEERFVTPSHMIVESVAQEEVEPSHGDEGATQGDGEDTPEAPAEPVAKLHRSHAKRSDPAYAQLIEALHQRIWDAGVLTDDPHLRVMQKVVARDLSRQITSHVQTIYPHLYRLGILKSTENPNECLVIQPGLALPAEQKASPVAVSKEATAPPMQADLSVLDLTKLDEPTLRERLRRLEAQYDTLELESEFEAFASRIDATRARAKALRLEAETLEREADGLVTERGVLGHRIQQLTLGKQQDDAILDLQWTIHNLDRIKRVTGIT